MSASDCMGLYRAPLERGVRMEGAPTMGDHRQRGGTRLREIPDEKKAPNDKER